MKKTTTTCKSETRDNYHDIVIRKYSEGVTAKEILNLVPVSKSTLYRWIEEYFGKEPLPEGVKVPRTPASMAKTIQAMQTRIAELEHQLEEEQRRTNVLRVIVDLLKTSNMV